MNDLSNREQAIELLQQLGLKEYEAKSFVALSRLPRGTAKDVSEVSEVPRTRVYDAISVLETKGLVEIQHSSPQRFRAVSVDEAVETLRSEYEERAESLRQTLRGLEPATVDEEVDVTHEVWALSGEAAITSRTRQLIDDADGEIVLVIGHGRVFTEELVNALRDAQQRGVTVIVGTISEALRDRINEVLPEIEVFVSRLEWLRHSALSDDETEISRLTIVDREAILVSSFVESASDGQKHEQAVFGRGFDNGLVAIARRLMATGLLPSDDPGT
jgi:sugar-specific transcriptional regulator TrmB